MRRAVQDYNMISEGDKIAIGVSGGKDSTTLLTVMRQLQHFYPEKFDIEAITLTMGIGNPDYSEVAKLCKDLGVNYTIHETQIGKIIFDIRQETNPCSMCANLRRGALHNVAKELGCNKVALGHHMDDVIETYMLSSLYEGRLHTFSPVTYLDRKDLYLIRPMIYSEEHQIRSYIKAHQLPIVKNPCPADGYTKRQYVKELLSSLQKENREVKSNLFGAIKRAQLDGWHE